ncbi:RloB domain-containing protein [Actinomyces sp. zg328]|uniref:RloB domain-containing protein n=1 Tax=Actinomyces sp. zg328 TaxID=2609287 RepID=UPI00135B2ADD|nr:RloB domain-containing protein [Actinomyces sp. zg328]
MAKKRKTSWKDVGRGSRRTGVRQPREVIDLIVEGATEKAYLQALLDHRYPGVFAPQWHRSGSAASRTSLKGLLDKARRAEREGRCQGVIWVVCDVDKNEVHRELLEKWRKDSPAHRSALQAVSIEGWILQHLTKPSRPTSSGEALSLVSKQWEDYAKGRMIPAWLIEQTDEACRRESVFLDGARNDGVWPMDRSSQLPLLIAYLDEQARVRRQNPPG